MVSPKVVKQRRLGARSQLTYLHHISTKREMMARPRKLKGHKGEAWAIFNHVGGVWTTQVWADQEGAEKHLSSQMSLFAERGWGDLSNHSVHPVNVTISPRPSTGDTP